MENFFKKLNNWIVIAVAGLVAVLSLVTGILNLCDGGNSAIGSFINSLIFIAMVCVLAFYVFNKKNDKGSVVVLILVGSAFLTAFGTMVDTFVFAGEINKEIAEFGQFLVKSELSKMRTMIAALVFEGLASLGFFVGVGSQVSLKLFDFMPIDKTKLVGTFAYLACGAFSFIAFILMIAASGGSQGNGLAINIITTFSLMAESFLFATLINKDF